MKKIAEKIRKKLGYLTISEFNNAIDSAVSKAVSESRRWQDNDTYRHSNPGLPGVQESHDDRFNLYKDHYQEDYKNKGNGKDSEKDFSVIESFTGGWHPHLDRAYDQSVQQLHRMQEVTLSKYFSDPHCRSIIDNWVNYTIGGSIKFNIDDEKVEEVIKEFRRRNNMTFREKEILRMGYTEGEVFLVYYINTITGDVKIRRIRPQEIVDIETHPEDVENYFAYHWYYQDSRTGTSQTYGINKWVRDINYDNFLDEHKNKGHYLKKRSKHHAATSNNIQIQFIKLGIDNEVRGRVPLQPVLRHLKYYEDWLIDRIILNHERSKVVWIKSIKGRNTEDWRNKGSAQRAPKGGVMLVESDNETYRIESAEIKADEAKEDGMAILHTIGAGASLPLHILNQRADMQNYSSIRKADTPFSQYIRDRQAFWAGAFSTMYREVIEQKVKAGELPEYTKVYDYSQESLQKVFTLINEAYVEGTPLEEVEKEVNKIMGDKPKKKRIRTIDIPLGIEFPEILREDLKAQAEVLNIHKNLGIVSLATLAAKAGYNWKQELHNLLVEKETLRANGFDEQEEKDQDPDNQKPDDKDDDESEPSGDSEEPDDKKDDKKDDKGEDKKPKDK